MVDGPPSPARFLRSEAAAVTVDWVVLTAALVGLGLAVTALLSRGVADLSGDTRGVMERSIVQTTFSRLGALFGTDFSSGADGWSGGTVVDVEGFGPVLRLGPNEAADLLVEVPDAAERATITFDLIGANDLSGEAAAILIDGEEVALYSDDHGSITLTDQGVPGVTVSVDQQYSNDHVGAGTIGKDSRATYTITVDDPSADMVLTVASRTGRPISEEFYAIDDVSVSAQ